MQTVSVIRVKDALQEVLDPCSVGRGVPAGLVDMGMVKAVEVGSAPDGRAIVAVELRITSPACTFQPYFEGEVRERLGELSGVGEVRITWDSEFDWSDDDMSPGLKQRLREKRHRLLALADTARQPRQ
jgi:metal-sulfur cluster biosynthetic enzyme